jgi:hypothetical protein
VTRAGAFANLLAIPGAVGLVPSLIRRTDPWPVALRILPRAGAILLLSPFVAQSTPLLIPAPQGAKPAAPTNGHCGDVDGMASLDLLPRTIVLAPLELGPAILAGSHDDAVSGPYHRDPQALEDVLRFFTADPATAQAIAARRQAGLVAFCPAGGEMTAMAKVAPHGLGTSLLRGSVPQWLQPVSLPASGGLKLFRVSPSRAP